MRQSERRAVARWLGWRLRHRRLHLGLTLAQVAGRIGTAEQWVARREAGAAGLPTLPTLLQVCSALDMCPGTLLRDLEAERRSPGGYRMMSAIAEATAPLQSPAFASAPSATALPPRAAEGAGSSTTQPAMGVDSCVQETAGGGGARPRLSALGGR